MCLQDDVNVSCSELSMCRHQQQQEPFPRQGYYQRGLYVPLHREAEGIYGPPAHLQRLTGDGESDAQGSSEYPASICL